MNIKCIKCSAENSFLNRQHNDRRCRSCNHQFVFEPCEVRSPSTTSKIENRSVISIFIYLISELILFTISVPINFTLSLVGIDLSNANRLTEPTDNMFESTINEQGRITSSNWDLYDTRHAIYSPTLMSVETLEAGYWNSYRQFYKWSSVFRGAWAKDDWGDRFRHLAYAGAWKKAEPVWDMLIRLKQVNHLLPSLENVLTSFGYRTLDSNVPNSLARSTSSQNLV
jgi:hypothetical protein